MAVMKCNMLSGSLGRRVHYEVIIPTMMFGDLFNPNYDYSQIRNLRTLYLLHGIGDCGSEWIANTRVQRLADEHKIAVVMIDGENSFYTDLPNGMRYGRYAGKEIVEATRALFPLSTRREDTFIAGLSMGGYGAIKTGLLYSDTFGAMASMSGALALGQKEEERLNDNPGPFATRESIFGSGDKFIGSDHDLFALLERKLQEGSSLPSMYVACGTEDFLYEGNIAFRDFVREKQMDFTYEEGEGGHTWEFWDCYLERILKWLPA